LAIYCFRGSLSQKATSDCWDLLVIALGTGLGFTAINIAALMGTRRGEEGLASELINTSGQIGGPIGLAVLLTIANFETPHLTGQVVQSLMAMGVTRSWEQHCSRG